MVVLMQLILQSKAAGDKIVIFSRWVKALSFIEVRAVASTFVAVLTHSSLGTHRRVQLVECIPWDYSRFAVRWKHVYGRTAKPH